MVTLRYGGICVTHIYEPLVYDLAHHESRIARWLKRLAGIWKVMGSTSVGGGGGGGGLVNVNGQRRRVYLEGHGFDFRWGGGTRKRKWPKKKSLYVTCI